MGTLGTLVTVLRSLGIRGVENDRDLSDNLRTLSTEFLLYYK